MSELKKKKKNENDLVLGIRKLNGLTSFFFLVTFVFVKLCQYSPQYALQVPTGRSDKVTILVRIIQIRK